jgi:hypothetical protein
VEEMLVEFGALPEPVYAERVGTGAGIQTRSVIEVVSLY